MSSRRTEDIAAISEKYLENTHRLLGSGGMGSVHLYRWKPGAGSQKIEVAVKKLDRPSNIQSLKEEAKILWDLHIRCPHILQLYGMVLLSAQGIGLVVEYMQHGNVTDFFRNVRGEVDIRHAHELKRRIAMQVCIGIDSLHSLPTPVLHCDLKARNVLLDTNLNVKICDFGLSKIQRLTSRPKSDGPSQAFVHGHGGTLTHIAPELLTRIVKPTKKSDVYSFAIFLWELVTEEEPYGDVKSDFILVNSVANGTRPTIDEIASDWNDLVKIMEECWKEDPSTRPHFGDLRRRLHRHGDIEDSVVACKIAWDRTRATNTCSTTFPKEVRSADNEGRFHVPESDNLDDDEPEMRLRSLNPNTDIPLSVEHQGTYLSDLRTGEVCVSSSSSSESTTSTAKEVVDPRNSDDASHVPLIGLSRGSSIDALARKCHIPKVIICFISFFVGCGAAFGIFWFTIHDLYAGCCINCFHTSNPVMQNNCSANGNSRAAVGSSCSFSCPDGYTLNRHGNELLCRSNGVWSGPMPYCRKIRQCPALKTPANLGKMNCTKGFNETSKCSFHCQGGYRLRLPGSNVKTLPDIMSVTCDADDLDNYKWSGPEPYCEKVVNCKQLIHDDNVAISCTPTAPSNGTICQLNCKDPTMTLEYEEPVAMCLEDGSWNVTKEITCLKACSSLPAVTHGNYSCNNGRKYSSTCTYSCDTNFFLVHGTRYISCLTEKMTAITVSGYINKLSSMLTSSASNSRYFWGELTDGNASITVVGFVDVQRDALNDFKENGSAVLLKDVNVRKHKNYEDLRVLIHRQSVIQASTLQGIEPELTCQHHLSYIRNILANNLSDVNIIVHVIRVEEPRRVLVNENLVVVRSVWVSDRSSDMRVDLCRDNAVVPNEVYEITHLKLRSFEGDRFLETTAFTKIFAVKSFWKEDGT